MRKEMKTDGDIGQILLGAGYGAAAGVASGALIGAGIGMLGGPIGAGVGAIVGTAVGTIAGVTGAIIAGSNSQKEEEAIDILSEKWDSMTEQERAEINAMTDD
jgi:hypothetical protein